MLPEFLSQVPLWAYFSFLISIFALTSKKIWPIGFGAILATLILVFGFHFVDPVLADDPPQEISMNRDDLIDIPIQVTVLTQNGKPSSRPNDYSLNNTPCEVSSKFPAQVLEWCGLITYYAKDRGLDPNLIAAVITQESGGQVEPCDSRGHMTIDDIQICGSRDGAIGLMQVMPRDGISGNKYTVFVNRPTSLELLNPETNIAYGTKMLENGGAATNPREALFHYGPAGGGYYYADIVMGIYQRNRK